MTTPNLLRRYTSVMLETRTATPADAKLITRHRRRMFVDAGRADNQVLDVMDRNFEPWVAKVIEEGKYIGWLSSDGDKVVAAAARSAFHSARLPPQRLCRARVPPQEAGQPPYRARPCRSPPPPHSGGGP